MIEGSFFPQAPHHTASCQKQKEVSPKLLGTVVVVVVVAVVVVVEVVVVVVVVVAIEAQVLTLIVVTSIHFSPR